MTSPPLIGITADDCVGSAQGASGSLLLANHYLSAIQRAGAVPIVLASQTAQAAIRRLIGILHGLVVSGGDFDIHPRYYGGKPTRQLGAIKARRTEFELNLVRAAIDHDLPVLGICGGAQAINVALGGSLYQDIATELGDAGAAEHTSRNSHGGHPVRIEPGTRLSRIFRRRRFSVNTSHHQSVRRLGHGLIVNAVADDGVIEGIESFRQEFIVGVQWHPEVLAQHQPLQRRLFSSFVEACGKRSQSL